MNDDEILSDLRAALRRDPPPLDAGRVAQVRALAAQAAPSSGTDGARPVPAGIATHPRRGLLLAAAAGIVGAVAGGAVVSVTRSDDDDSGFPLEAIGLQGVPAGVRADASVVDHTWGMELLLDVEGLPVGDRYDVVFVARNGDRLPVGGFVGAEVPVLCRNTSPLLRADAASVEVLDAAGAVVMSSTLA